MKEDEVVPEKLSNPLNYKVIGSIFIGIIILHILINTIDELGILVYSWSMSIPLAIVIFSFWTVKKYSGALVYSKAFKLLGLSFIGIFGGEIIYFIYEPDTANGIVINGITSTLLNFGAKNRILITKNPMIAG